MTLRDYTANVISASKVVPDGAFQDSAASGVWDINEALDLIKGGNWPTTGNFNPAAFVDGLFQCHLYDGTGSQQTITNNIDFTKGGLIITKRRDSSTGNGPYWNDTERGVTNYVRSDSDGGTGAQNTSSTGAVVSTSSTGYVVGTFNGWNNSSGEYVSWTFRKQPKFFDIVTYSGTGSNQNISHNLGSVPGMILIKDTSASNAWTVYHRGVDSSAPEDYSLNLGSTAARDDATSYFNDTAPTSSVFTVGTTARTNNNGSTYVAYLFAHNNSDGGFGEPGDQDIIKCDSYTGNGSSTGPSVNLGFEPQFVMIKNASSTQNWWVLDNMRGIVSGAEDIRLKWNTSDSEDSTGDVISLTPTGFDVTTSSSSTNTNGDTYVYMAIRRGGMQTPTVASSVFSIDTFDNSGDPKYDSTHVVDMALIKLTDDTGDWFNYARPMGFKYLSTNDTGAEANASEAHFDHMRGFSSSDWGNNDYQAWMWKRARGYFDVVTYTGTGSNRTVSHNLGVAPEMMWVKNRDTTNDDWYVYVSGITHLSTYGSDPDSYGSNPAALTLNSTDTANFSMSGVWNHTHPTSTVFSTGDTGATNGNGEALIAYLFASVAGVSKIGSYTGNGSSQTIDCGFTSGSKFVLIKRVNDTGHWQIWDTTRGLVDGNDTRLILNGTGANLTGYDMIDPDNSGFAVTNANDTNESGRVYIFYAIANDPS